MIVQTILVNLWFISVYSTHIGKIKYKLEQMEQMNGADGRVGLQHALRSDLEDNKLADGGESLTKSNSHLVRKCTKVRHFLEDLIEVSHSQDSLSSHFKNNKIFLAKNHAI
ncbi:uncharacterized protein PGTG_15459 [Puccinia graminis f. sp. tritici CRL 75-36-700-3]|uniref:Uncharacterized protein n=1 Tax=Puccinia graminis f. sp. tritici (strain CRL 75-36-700-3 / race SCCL) TaxID=418459 RepID=E3KYK3_PUCGT|nr:uncharacterized protein PGTG_15459 [Puccinia graminis f. sp. tritici CRL 75-36-700-3]EFP89280.1 hypothetical protein PGTG_15459 [Puccinia graminis f. sp. tritici CRL 75-36-700-3]